MTEASALGCESLRRRFKRDLNAKPRNANRISNDRLERTTYFSSSINASERSGRRTVIWRSRPAPAPPSPHQGETEYPGHEQRVKELTATHFAVRDRVATSAGDCQPTATTISGTIRGSKK